MPHPLNLNMEKPKNKRELSTSQNVLTEILSIEKLRVQYISFCLAAKSIILILFVYFNILLFLEPYLAKFFEKF